MQLIQCFFFKTTNLRCHWYVRNRQAIKEILRVPQLHSQLLEYMTKHLSQCWFKVHKIPETHIAQVSPILETWSTSAADIRSHFIEVHHKNHSWCLKIRNGCWVYYDNCISSVSWFGSNFTQKTDLKGRLQFYIFKQESSYWKDVTWDGGGKYLNHVYCSAGPK